VIILGVVGSMRRGRNTDTLVRRAVDGAVALTPGARADILYTADYPCAPCRVACSGVCTSPPYRCAIQDGVSEILARMTDAGAVILGTPQYFRAPPSGFHSLMERLTSLRFFQETRGANIDSPLAGKTCGLVAVAEYSNPQPMLEYLHDACLLLAMRPVCLSAFPYLGVGGHGNPETDDVFKPLERAHDLGRAVARSLAAAESRTGHARDRV
jgi:multimeric flavodoxin WrbA